MSDLRVVVLESHHAEPFHAAPFRHPFAKLLLVIDGRGTLRAGGQTYDLRRGVLAHIPPRVRHDIDDLAGEPLSLYGVCYHADSDGPRSRLLPGNVIRWSLGDVSAHLARSFRTNFREMLFEQWARQEGWEALLEARLAEMIVAAARIEQRLRRSADSASQIPGGASAERVAAYVARLESGGFLCDTLDDAARACALSRRRFTDLFRAGARETWLKHVQRLRIEHARRLLRDTDKSIAAVAFESGFDNASHFHRVFKSVVGRTPMKERGRARHRAPIVRGV